MSIKRCIIKAWNSIDGALKTFPGQPMHIDLILGATPVYRRPYPVPQVHLDIRVLPPVRDPE